MLNECKNTSVLHFKQQTQHPTHLHYNEEPWEISNISKHMQITWRMCRAKCTGSTDKCYILWGNVNGQECLLFKKKTIPKNRSLGSKEIFPSCRREELKVWLLFTNTHTWWLHHFFRVKFDDANHTHTLYQHTSHADTCIVLIKVRWLPVCWRMAGAVPLIDLEL